MRHNDSMSLLDHRSPEISARMTRPWPDGPRRGAPSAPDRLDARRGLIYHQMASLVDRSLLSFLLGRWDPKSHWARGKATQRSWYWRFSLGRPPRFALSASLEICPMRSMNRLISSRAQPRQQAEEAGPSKVGVETRHGLLRLERHRARLGAWQPGRGDGGDGAAGVGTIGVEAAAHAGTVLVSECTHERESTLGAIPRQGCAAISN